MEREHLMSIADFFNESCTVGASTAIRYTIDWMIGGIWIGMSLCCIWLCSIVSNSVPWSKFPFHTTFGRRNLMATALHFQFCAAGSLSLIYTNIVMGQNLLYISTHLLNNNPLTSYFGMPTVVTRFFLITMERHRLPCSSVVFLNIFHRYAFP